MAIQVNTAAVFSAADQIDKINKNVQEDLSDIESAILTLKCSWEGEASKVCYNTGEHILKNYTDARFHVVNNLVSFMKIQVGESYNITEHSVSTAASAFK